MKEKEEKMREEENALDWVRSDRLLLPSSTSLSSLHFRLHSYFSSFSSTFPSPSRLFLLLPFSSPLLLLVTFSSFFPSLLLSSLLSSFAVLHRAEVYIFIHLLSSLLLRCEFEDVVLDQEGPGVGIHMFIIIVNTIDISAPVAHRGQAPVPPSFSLFNKSIRERLWACWGTTSSHPQCRLVQPSPTASSPELFEAKLCSSIKLSDLLKATSSYYTTFIITTTQLLTRSPSHLLTHSLTYNPIRRLK